MKNWMTSRSGVGALLGEKGWAVPAFVLLVLLATVPGCGTGRTSVPPTSEWATFRGDGVSVRLPAFFQGGDPADDAVMATLQRMAESSPESGERVYLTDWLESVKYLVSEGRQYPVLNSSPLLAVLGDLGGGRALVGVEVKPYLLSDVLAVSNGDSSMQGLVDAWMFGRSESNWTLDSLDTDRATVIVRYEGVVNPPPPTLMVLKPSGKFFYVISYWCDERSWDDLIGTFRESSKTIRIGTGV